MKKSLKISLIIISLAFLAIILGTTNVNAAEPIIFQTIQAVELKEIDLGTIEYNTSVWQTFKIKNTTSDEITITNVSIDTEKFEIERMPDSTIAPNETTFIQINNIRGIDVSESPVTGNLTVTVNGTTNVSIPLKVTLEKGTHRNPSYISEAAIGDKLSTITLTNGWIWVNPDAPILEGQNKYQISYTDTTGNYKDEIREIEIKGLNTYSVTLPSNPNTWTSPQVDYRLLEGYSSTLSINASAGFLLTSITINGVEQITNKMTKFEYKITDIREDIVIEAQTERIVFSPMKDTITNEIIAPKYILGTEGNIQLKYDYDFDKFYNHIYGFYNISDIRIDGETLSFEDIFKCFKFTEGSVVVEISNEYLNALGVGTHNFELDLASGELFEGTFIIEEKVIDNQENVENETTGNSEVTENTVIDNPKTSDNITIYVSLFVLSLIGIVGTMIIKRKINN